MSATGRKEVIFIASALEDLRAFPDDVKSAMGFAIYQAQCGGKHISAKPLRGFKGTGA